MRVRSQERTKIMLTSFSCPGDASDRRDVDGQLHAFVKFALHRRAHDSDRDAYDFRLIFRNSELEVLDEIADHGLHLDQAANVP